MERRLNILFVSSEVFPFSKTGGLADVSRSLPETLASFGHDVRVITPKYRDIGNAYVEDMGFVQEYTVELGWRKQKAGIHQLDVPVLGQQTHHYPIYFLENPYYFDREGLYGHEDDAERFAFFCKAVLEMLPTIGFHPDIIHCNDWPTAPICMLLKEKYGQHGFYENIRTLFTIHNLGYQGLFSKEALYLLELDDRWFHPESIEFYGKVNFIKAGLVYADLLNTVSETYAEEIQTEEYGCGLEGVLRKRKSDLYGIVNGIDYVSYNPKTDENIYCNYDIDSIEDKNENKLALLKELNLPKKDSLVISTITRIVAQKGFGLIGEILEELLKEDIVFIIMGSGDPVYEEMLHQVGSKYKENFKFINDYQFSMARKIYAGSDACIMPSEFEPCGLNQIISMRYGTIPVVRKTGGLADTVKQFDPITSQGTGIVFEKFESGEILEAIRKVKAFYDQKPVWEKIIQNAMSEDLSWEQVAKKYEKLYEQIIE